MPYPTRTEKQETRGTKRKLSKRWTGIQGESESPRVSPDNDVGPSGWKVELQEFQVPKFMDLRSKSVTNEDRETEHGAVKTFGLQAGPGGGDSLRISRRGTSSQYRNKKEHIR